MNNPSIAIVKLKSGACRHGNCDALGELLRAAPFAGRIRVETNTTTAPSTTPSPAVVVVRCVSDGRLAPALNNLRERWPRAAFLGAFCDPVEASAGSMRELTRQLDDFFWCPVRQADFLPRVERLLPEPKSDGTLRIRELKVRHHMEAFVGESGELCRLLEKIPCVAACEAACVISGETGTGKELVARAIHYGGARRNKPFVPVNCGALPDHLFENELFGHHRGAYTDASCDEAGLLAVAAEGTIFLDEVDALSPAAQVKLLRFLQDREYRPLGAARAITANVRVLAATNADLRRLVEARQFREDLYHRLNVVYLQMPPLRERAGDIPALADHFLERYRRQHRPGSSMRLQESAMQKLLSYSWPGNIRELEAVVQRSVILVSQELIRAEDIDLPGVADPPTQAVHFRAAKSHAIEEFERAYLVRLLEQCGGNVSRAARSAGKERRAFQRLLQKHRVEPKAFSATA